MKKDQVRTGNQYSAKSLKAARLAVAGVVGPGGERAAEGASGRKAASPRPKPTPSGTRAKRKTQVRPTKGTKPRAPRKPNPDRPLSGLDAAAKVLADKGEPMRVRDIVEVAAKKGYWKSKAGKTPEATVYAAIIREIRDKGVDARFVKKGRGLFAAGKGA